MCREIPPVPEPISSTRPLTYGFIRDHAGAYGFESLTRSAHQAEEILEALKAPIKERTTTTIAQLLVQLDRMDEAFAEIRRTQLRLAGGSEEVLLHIPEHKVEYVQHLSKTLATVFNLDDIFKHVTDLLFDLTPAEARLAAVIAGGHPPRDAALRLGVTEATARTTLKRILAKTGTRRQADLVGLLKSAAGPR